MLTGGTGVAVTERPAATTSEQRLRAYPRLADGVELLGEYEGSGYKEPHYLARRADGQLIQLSYLLYLVASAADGERDFEAIADRVTHASQRGLTGDDVRYLVEEKLRSLGVLAAADGSDAAVAKVDPLLALKFRAKVIPERVVHRLAAVFRPLFWPPVVLAVLVAFAALDVWLFFVHGVAQSLRDTLYDPVLFLVVLGMVVLSAGFHEFGHAAACAYGGARPGVMGAGIYLAWPAFYTDVSDSYRLSRAGRLRTDLGGVYFNAVFSLATVGLYFVTGFEPLLLVIAVQQIEIVHQLMPFVRLDGYYIVADLTGVPDLFMRTKAILRSLLPWVPTDKRVTDLKPWVRAVVTIWVLVVLPLLLFQVLVIGMHMPRIVATGWDSLGDQWTTASASISAGEPFTAVVAIVQMVVLTIPLLGIALMFVMLARRTVDALRRWSAESPPRRAVVVVAASVAVGLLAYTWWPNGDYEPIRPGEKGTVQDLVRATADVPGGRPAFTPDDAAALEPESPALEEPPPAPAPPETEPAPEPVPTTAPVSTTSTTAPTATTVAAPREEVPDTEPEAPVPDPAPEEQPPAEGSTAEPAAVP